MGPDESVLFRQWGHAALCIAGRCLNYGVTDFSRSLGLVFDVLRGRAVFWVSVSPYEAVLDAYIRDDRSVFRQEVALFSRRTRSAARAAGRRSGSGAGRVHLRPLRRQPAPPGSAITSTRAADGALREPVALPEPFQGRGGRSTFRTHIRRGLTGRPLLLWLSDVGVGAAVDRPITSFEGHVPARRAAPGRRSGLRRAPVAAAPGPDGDLLPSDPGSGPYLPWLFGIAGGLAVLIAAPRTGRLRRLAVAGVGGRPDPGRRRRARDAGAQPASGIPQRPRLGCDPRRRLPAGHPPCALVRPGASRGRRRVPRSRGWRGSSGSRSAGRRSRRSFRWRRSSGGAAGPAPA